MSKIIFISGIGADKRAFSNLRISNKLEHIYAEWLPLERKNESFESYCNRLILKYEISSEDILIGLSFGGLVSQEIAKKLRNKQVILISSFRNKSDLKPIMYYGLKLKLNRLLPPFRIPIVSDLIAYLLNSGKKESKKVLADMLKVADFRFINWAIRQIDQVDLKSNYKEHYLSFTGTNDKLVSNWSHKHSIDAGSHFMVFDKAEQISDESNLYIN